MGNATSNQNTIVQGSITMGSKATPLRRFQASEDDLCTICIDKSSNDYVTLQCGHHFHRACVKPWIQRRQSCPICRQYDAITFPPLVILPPISIQEVSHENQPLLITPTIRIPDVSYEDQYFIMNATIAHDIQAAITMIMNESRGSSRSMYNGTALPANAWNDEYQSSFFIGPIGVHDTVMNSNLQAEQAIRRMLIQNTPSETNDDDQLEGLEPII